MKNSEEESSDMKSCMNYNGNTKKDSDPDQFLYIDRLLWPVTALGPGQRIALWISGCTHHCYNCANPELWEKKPSQKIPIKKLQNILTSMCTEKKVDGLTITGGEPFDQSAALIALLDGIAVFFPDVLIYSGYPKEELEKSPIRKELLRRVDVLVDGPYKDELNKPSIVLRGSENQKIYYQNQSIKEKYETYLRKGRQIQNFVYDYKIISVGIHSNPKNLKQQEIKHERKN